MNRIAKAVLMLIVICMVWLVGHTTGVAAAGSSTRAAKSVVAGAGAYEQLSRSRHCSVQEATGWQECTYRAGQSLQVTIVAVGRPEVTINFVKSDFEGDFYGSVANSHGCVVVSRGKAGGSVGGWAFISPRDGRVYDNWRDCPR